MADGSAVLATLARQLRIDEKVYAELVELFVEVGTTDLTRLRAAVAQCNPAQAAESAHSLKGSASQIGLMLFAETAWEIERTTRAQAWGSVAEQVEKLQDRFRLIAGLLGS